MYAMPFPWFMPGSQTHNDMGPKDWIEFIKAWDEYQKSNKPKDEKKDKPKDPNEWSTNDYWLAVMFIWAIAIPVGACTVLYFATQFVKALH